ncbi:MAG TPA: urease subunit alpha, partial [Stellaceae bacterium]|nr:urease subunit alpha [Stellaceae bacterium]
GAFGRACAASAVTFVRGAALARGIGRELGLARKVLAVSNTRGGISKASMVLNDRTPKIEVDPETYEVRADGELLICEPATVLPMAQRYFLF